MKVARRDFMVWGLLILALVVVAMMADRGGSGSLDPRSVDPDGARGVVQVLEELGADVAIDRSVPEDDDSSALLLEDRLTDDDRDRLMEWVEAGGVLVVADPTSPLTPGTAARQTGPIAAGNCTIPALSGAELITTRSANLFPRTDASCFGDREFAHIVAEPRGAGNLVSIGGPGIFTNAALDEADEAVVLVALLAPDPDAARVAFLAPSVVALGDEDVTDLVPTRVTNAVLQLMVAFLLYALFRARRLGPVVSEPLPVRIEGSELVLGAGRLAERAKDPASTASVLRADLNLRSRRALGVRDDVDEEALAALIATATDVEHERVVASLNEPVTDEDGLVRIAREIDELHTRLFAAQEAR